MDATGVGSALDGARDATNAVSPARFAATTCGERVATARVGVVEGGGALLVLASCVRRRRLRGPEGRRSRHCRRRRPTVATRDDGDASLERYPSGLPATGATDAGRR